MNICVISPNFPFKESVHFIFVEQICKEFADHGHNIYVVSPQSLTKILFRKNTKLTPQKYTITTGNGNIIRVYRPLSISFSNGRTSMKIFNYVVNNQLERLHLNFDVIYGHFWESAFAGLSYAKKNAIPLFAVSGEDYITINKYMTNNEVADLAVYHSGNICVSSKSKEESIQIGFTKEEKTIIIPNAINPSIFFKRNKIETRKKLGVSNDDFIVAYVGQFTERKGINRLCEALNRMNNKRIKAMFIGSGSVKINYDNIIVRGKVNHKDLPLYLNAADIFVLPTLSEGCCNAIVEAMACGLPIVSTNASFNWDILNKENSILINPTSIEQIIESITQLYENKELLDCLSKGALRKAKHLTLSKRAEKILNYINKNI